MYTSDFLKAVAVSASGAAVGVGVAALVTWTGAPIAVATGISIVAGAVSTLIGDRIKKRWIGD